jgi:hypothetical protein
MNYQQNPQGYQQGYYQQSPQQQQAPPNGYGYAPQPGQPLQQSPVYVNNGYPQPAQGYPEPSAYGQQPPMNPVYGQPPPLTQNYSTTAMMANTGPAITYQRAVEGLNGWNDPPKTVFSKGSVIDIHALTNGDPVKHIVGQVAEMQNQVREAYKVTPMSN